VSSTLATVAHEVLEVDGVPTFCRQSGPSDAPVVLLPYAYRNLLPSLGDQWRPSAIANFALNCSRFAFRRCGPPLNARKPRSDANSQFTSSCYSPSQANNNPASMPGPFVLRLDQAASIP
jgi:hypothetical protein